MQENERNSQDQIALFESELHEFQLVEGIQDDEKHFYIRGKFATIEHLNINERFYPRALWEREVAKYQAQIENGTINTLMEWEHPKGRLTVDPKNAVAKITKLWIEGDYVMGEAVIFDTPQAETIKSMIRHGVKISVSSRASGSVGSNKVVKEFNLITFDIVTNPSDQSATMSGVFESEEDEAINTTENLEDNEMSNKSLMENLVGILRSKNVEIQDLNEEIEILRDTIHRFGLGVGNTDAPYGDTGARGYRPKDDSLDRYAEERADYTWRNALTGYRDYGNNRHQDVNATIVDNDPSGYYASGESERSRIIDILNAGGRSNFISSSLDADVSTGGIYGSSGNVVNTPSVAQTGKGAEKAPSQPTVGRAINEASVSKIRKEAQRLAKLFGIKIMETDDTFDGESAYFEIDERAYSRAVKIIKQSKDPKEEFGVNAVNIISGSDTINFTVLGKESIDFTVYDEDDDDMFESPKGHAINESTNRFLKVPNHMI